jgi:SNF2 family DNA or RNA helicase/uncharacterized Zn finger protein
MAAAFGKTWWGEQWLNSLNNIDYSNRLPRGASYARKGAVEKIKITGNHISAKVRGRRPSPYKVDIILPPFFDPELGNFLTELTKRPVIISKLLNRELDPDVLELAEQSGLKVFPRQWNDLKMQCSCPDWAVPCKHLASVIYKVSAEIDNNPFLVFSLHNVDLLTEMAKMGIYINKQNIEIPKIQDLCFSKEKAKIEYDSENAYRKLSFAKLEPIHGPLTSLLSPSPAFYTASGSDFRDKYLATLNRIVKNTHKAAQGKTSLPDFFENAYSEEQYLDYHSDNQVRLDESLKAKVAINDKEYSVSEFFQQLSQIQSSKTYDYQPSTAALHTVLHFAIQLVANGAIVPQIVRLPDKQYSIRWLPALLSKEIKKLVNELEQILPPDVFTGICRKKQKAVNNDVPLNLLSLFITEIVRLVSYNTEGDLFLQLFFKNESYPFSGPGEEALAGGIMSWLQKFYITRGDYSPMLIVEELKDDKFRILINIREPKGIMDEPVPLTDILNDKKYYVKRFEILQSLTQLSSFIPGLDAFINSGGKKELVMDNQTFTPFLMQMIPAIQLLDISVLLPKSLQQILKPKASVKLKSKATGKSYLRLDKLLDFEWQVALGDTVMDEIEFRKLLQKSEGLIRFKSQYIYVEKQDLEKLYKHFSQSKELSTFQLLRTALSGEYNGAKVFIDNEVKKLIKELTEFRETPVPAGLTAQLRPYQRRGYSWIYRNARVGFGSVLADDMGLGKTIQVITAILKFKEEGLLSVQKVLVIAPTGLLTNWQAEFQKFAPGINTDIYHGPQRDLKKLNGYDVLITSYGIARSDASLLKKEKWHAVVIDEAQNIKNQNTAQTKAVKSIKSDNFIALSGTPVENRLSELWSIMDYSNRGFLGSLKEFSETYGNPIEQLNDLETAKKLKTVTAPFLMRRLKSDKTIISDLPEKIEIDSFATLTKEQAVLYEKTLEKAMDEIEGITRTDQKSLFVRQGLLLQMILALKQICNHPAQFLKNGDKNASLSGKTELLFDKLDSIMESREKVLLFTQFTEMAVLLKHFISERYKTEPLYYHGGCSINQRKEMIHRFQTNHADKLFLLSLKAAGTGLNLTAASHVIHYDLWWNPAVEAQATDRAYRIGQKNNVMVHRFITKNTFEEKINAMIQQKKALAEMTVATGENWVGNLSNKELRDIFNIS